MNTLLSTDKENFYKLGILSPVHDKEVKTTGDVCNFCGTVVGFTDVSDRRYFEAKFYSNKETGNIQLDQDITAMAVSHLQSNHEAELTMLTLNPEAVVSLLKE